MTVVRDKRDLLESVRKLTAFSMNVLEMFLVTTLLVSQVHSNSSTKDTLPAVCSDICNELKQLKKTVLELTKQVMRQQTYMEDWIRSNGNSGINIVRSTRRGIKNYDSGTHLNPAAFGIHDHSNYDRTLGLAELHVNMNGIAFCSRHNDYKLVMPSTTSNDYHAYEEIPFPEVPPEVLSKPTVKEQIIEMREWFRAFHQQDNSKRDYTKYFKPLMCYMEGAWTLDTILEEPFPSDRHWLDAKSWDHLYLKFRFNAFTGVKNRLENVANLPRTIMSINEKTGQPQYAQWNYRIACVPINYDIPLTLLQQEDDLSFRVDSGQSMVEAERTRAARYKLFDTERKHNYQVMDEIFSRIPGKDNYGANSTYTIHGEEMFTTEFTGRNEILNTAYYHRAYKTTKNGAGGVTNTPLGLNDEFLFVAETQQERVAPFDAEKCRIITNEFGKLATRCKPGHMRVSYAIPLEIVYMTPLLAWNPYNITIHNDTITSATNGRSGGTEQLALNGADRGHYYLTPAEFFTGNIDKSDPADTVRNYLYVEASDGSIKKCSASGTRIVLQKIGDVGKIRLRYPISSVYGEGSSVWKELNALRDLVKMGNNEGPPSSVSFQMSISVQDPPGEHTHSVVISYEDFTMLMAGDEIYVTAQQAQEHTHDLTIIYVPKTKSFKYIECDTEEFCTDGHAPKMILETRNPFTIP